MHETKAKQAMQSWMTTRRFGSCTQNGPVMMHASSGANIAMLAPTNVALIVSFESINGKMAPNLMANAIKTPKLMTGNALSCSADR